MSHVCRSLWLLSVVLSAGATADDAFWRKIDSPRDERDSRPSGMSIEQMMERYGVAGLSIALISAGGIDTRCYGIADAETAAPVTPESLFQAASISKSVNAFAVRMAIEKGLFTSDQDINTVLKRWQLERAPDSGTAAATPHLLMSHAAGIGVRSFPGYSPNQTIPDVIGVLDGGGITSKVIIAFEPGVKFQYAGGGTTVLQLALEDATGQPYPELLREWVLEPIGMSASTFEQPVPESLRSLCALAHGEDRQRMEQPWHVYPELAAAGLWTTPGDLCKFAQAVQAALIGAPGALLSKESVIPMLTPLPTGRYAEGFEVTGDSAAEGEFSHSGGNWGYSCLLTAVKNAPYACAIMTNGGNSTGALTQITQRVRIAQQWPSLRRDAED